jgi:nicotinamide-nucleotide amidase
MCEKEDAVATGSLEQRLGDVLSRRGLTIAVAESCTGGLISHRITNVPGASRYFLIGTVAYSNEVKVERLAVDPALLDSVGAVSGDVALAMARGVRTAGGSDIGVGVTGIAGPAGGTPEKPVGLVFIAAVTVEDERVERHVFAGDRAVVKRQTADAALALVLEVAQT